METSLHRELKQRYAQGDGSTEVRFGSFRIDAIRNGELIEIQFASLAAIRKKIESLVQQDPVRIVKPIIAERRIIRQQTADGPVTSRRKSPKRGSVLDVFEELIYLTRIFPHPNLTIDVPLVRVEEWRLPPAAEPRRWRRYRAKHRVKDVVLTEIVNTSTLTSAACLLRLINAKQLPAPFDTGELAAHLDCSRPVAQRIAYVLRQIGAIRQCGKRGNALAYKTVAPRRRSKAA